MYEGVCKTAHALTHGFVLNHSMLRVKDPAVSLDFYSRIMGMRVLRKLDFPEMKFSLYFLAVAELASSAPDQEGERTAWTFSQSGILELTHNWGTESDPDFKYHDGNAQQRDPDDQRDTQGEHVQLSEQPGVARGANCYGIGSCHRFRLVAGHHCTDPVASVLVGCVNGSDRRDDVSLVRHRGP